MKYLCFAVIFLYASFLHSAIEGCVTEDQMAKVMEIAKNMEEGEEIGEVCREYMVFESDPDAFQKRVEECVGKMKEMEEAEKNKIKTCLQETYVTIIDRMPEEIKIPDECFQQMMENCPLQQA